MNRQQRRIKITNKDLQQAYLDGIRFAVKCYSATIAMVLHDKLGFGAERLIRVMDQIQGSFDAIQMSYATVNDFEEALREECGLIFKDGRINASK